MIKAINGCPGSDSRPTKSAVMERVSTNLTLFYKFFIPVFWLVFVGSITVAALIYSFDYIGNMPAGTFRLIMVFIFLSGALSLYLTLLRLKRVELSEDFVYVTNYFKSFRYPYHNVESIQVSRFLFFQVATVRLREAGSFGKSILFIPSSQRFKLFFAEHPDLKVLLHAPRADRKK